MSTGKSRIIRLPMSWMMALGQLRHSARQSPNDPDPVVSVHHSERRLALKAAAGSNAVRIC